MPLSRAPIQVLPNGTGFRESFHLTFPSVELGEVLGKWMRTGIKTDKDADLYHLEEYFERVPLSPTSKQPQVEVNHELAQSIRSAAKQINDAHRLTAARLRRAEEAFMKAPGDFRASLKAAIRAANA